VLLGCQVAAAILQALILVGIEDRTRDLRTDVCRIATAAHIRVIHCGGP